MLEHRLRVGRQLCARHPLDTSVRQCALDTHACQLIVNMTPLSRD